MTEDLHLTHVFSEKFPPMAQKTPLQLEGVTRDINCDLTIALEGI